MSGLEVGARLLRALARHARNCGLDVTIPSSSTTRWASATFTGARHELVLALTADDGAECWLADLPEAELALPGHLIADLKIVRMRQDGTALSATLEVLTVEDR